MSHPHAAAALPYPPVHRWRTPRAVFRRRPRTRWQRGQSLVIFALTFTILLGLAGLAIDVVRAYDLFAREHRAAEAGALAGDLYMPCFYNAPTSGIGCGPGTSPDGNSAISRALLEVQKNGFGQGVTPPTSCTGADTSQAVTICTAPQSQTALEVTITQPISVFFLAVLGIQPFNVTATAAADYVPNTILGTGDSSGGGQVWGGGGVAQPKTFLAVINGPAEFQEQGDPFVYCQEGPTSGPPPDGDFNSTSIPLQDSTTGTVAGFSTNHAPFGSGPECGANKDVNNLQPSDLTGPQTPQGNDVYSYYVWTPAPAHIFIWNPNFDPSPPQSSCQGSQTPDVFLQDVTCSTYYQTMGAVGNLKPDSTNPLFDDPRMYFNLTYTVYSMPSAFGSPGGVQIAPQTFPPLDLYPNDVAAHCLTGNAYRLPAPPLPENSSYDGPVVPGVCGTIGGPGYMVGTWADLGAVPAGQYRVAVEATSAYPTDGCGTFTCGWGRHTFDVGVCAVGSAPNGDTCTAPSAGGLFGFVAPLNDADIYLNFPGKTSVQVPVAFIPPSYAGRTITFSVFNPGVAHGKTPNTFFTMVPPDCSPITIPSTSPNWYRVTTAPGTPPGCAGGGPYNWVESAVKGGGGLSSGDFIYHGLWVDIPVKIPANYAGGQWFFAQVVANGAKDFGQICLKVSVNGGSPIHLIL